ncbi:hypothetical protein BSL78_18427 [Apostichopus japonicus]|uniref:triacylglycerol lipase n=1 Tax=Stichopus japonicus TaxID=307972 RepID=A0A2G8K9M2_STIJA|nr:hypothetical protein BSL78_18427 [Apostichopus japonicus]
MNITFAGCGFLGIYHVGVGSCFAVHAPNLIQKAGGASAGALAACCMLCGSDLGKITEDVLNTATSARSRTLGPLSPRFDINQVLLDGLKETLPEDAHKIVSGRLFVSLTRVSDRQNIVVSKFTSKDDLIQALLCSAFVPFYSGIVPPSFRGTRYVDGGISDNLPKVSGDTVTVSPFSGESDICPPSEEISRYLQITLSNTHIQLTASNLYRLSRALFPPDPKVLAQMCKQGFNDALAYLRTNNLLPCEKHKKTGRSKSLPVLAETGRESLAKRTSEVQRPTFNLEEEEEVGDRDPEGYSEVSEEEEIDLMEDEVRMEEVEQMKEVWQTWESEDFFDECEDCKKGSECLALDPALPPQVVDALQASCRKVNSGLANFLYNSRIGHVLQIASVPYVLPFETAYSLTRRFVKWLPYLPTNFQWFISGLIKAVEHIFSQMEDNKAFKARFSCHLDMTEDYVSDFAKHWFRVTRLDAIENRRKNDVEALDIASGPAATNVRHNLNFEFSMDFETSCPDGSNSTPELLRRISEDQGVRSRVPRIKAGATPTVDDEINSGMQDSFDYTIKVAQEMEDALYFHYLQVSQSVSYDQGQSSVEIHEI